MQKSILVLDADKDQCRGLCELLEKGQFKATPLFSTHNLEKNIEDTGCRAILWDIDTVTADNRTVRDLTLKFPGVYFFCMSKHPPVSPGAKRRDLLPYLCLYQPADRSGRTILLVKIDR
jgi:DNA-binding NtrC family response regulator